MEVKKNQLAQDINSIEEINNNPEPVIEITPTPTQETIPMIEDIIEPNLEPIENVEDIPTIAEAIPVIERTKNTVRYIDGGFTF
jgi:hypothetical protein